jgi:ABC-type transport system involved in cytochrome c biogenesis ATPase subunit
MDDKGKSCVRRQIQDHCRNGGIVVAASHEPLGLNGASVELE